MRRTARALGVNRPVPMQLDDLTIPDSQLARDATALAQGCEPRFLFNHSVRSYLFGLAVGKHLGLQPDVELLYLAAILHDIGLVPEYDRDGSFELNGARAAREFLVNNDMATARADLVHEAIALHAAVGIAGSREPEIALMHYGAGVDVIGFRAEDVAMETRQAVLADWPRASFKSEFAKLVEDQSTRKPECHIAGHYRLGFNGKIAAAPFAE